MLSPCLTVTSSYILGMHFSKKQVTQEDSFTLSPDCDHGSSSFVNSFWFGMREGEHKADGWPEAAILFLIQQVDLGNPSYRCIVLL